jgi:hypothetical protein
VSDSQLGAAPALASPSEADLEDARALHKQGRLAEAERIYQAIRERDPGHTDVLHHLGQIRIEQGDRAAAHELLTAALASCDKALEQAADQATTLGRRGYILVALQRYFEAVVSYDRALALKPGWVEAHIGRGFSLYCLNRYEAALASFDKAVALHPNRVETWLHRGRTFRKLNRFEEALASFDQALALEPNHAVAYNSRGETLAGLARYDEAAAHYEIASNLDPNFIQPRWNAAITRLLHGDFRRGWQDYECRWQHPGVTARDFRAPLWLGDADLAGKTLLLHAEQGFGDTIQFVRYASLAAERGANVILEVQWELKSLLSRMKGASAVLAQPKEKTVGSRIDGAPVPLAREEDLPAFDCHCPLLSLPLAFKTELTSVPAPIPYIHADPGRLKRWKGRLRHQGFPLVGIAWSGSPTHWEDHNRSIALGRLLPLLTEPFGFVSLQKTMSPRDAKVARDLPGLIHFGDDLADFEDTAAIIESLDLVITVDTAVAHLAGAMGKPVWLILAHAPEWRWLLDREDTPWYPNMRLFRQPRLDDWESVIERVRKELGTKAG